VLGGVFLLRLTNAEEDGFEDINIRVKRHNMALNGATGYDGTSYNKRLRIVGDKKMHVRQAKYERTLNITK
jgi:hypothetical protein